MTNWRPNFQPEHLYFVTTKAVGYAHVFQRDVMKRLLVSFSAPSKMGWFKTPFCSAWIGKSMPKPSDLPIRLERWGQTFFKGCGKWV